MTRASKLALICLAAIVVLGLPFLGKWSRRNAPPRCALDGLTIEPRYSVSISMRDSTASFCCIRCARSWLSLRSEPPTTITVTDESSGTRIDARSAHFVESSIITNAVTGNRIHVFAVRADAEEHARAFAGRILPVDEVGCPLP